MKLQETHLITALMLQELPRSPIQNYLEIARSRGHELPRSPKNSGPHIHPTARPCQAARCAAIITPPAAGRTAAAALLCAAILHPRILLCSLASLLQPALFRAGSLCCFSFTSSLTSSPSTVVQPDWFSPGPPYPTSSPSAVFLHCHHHHHCHHHCVHLGHQHHQCQANLHRNAPASAPPMPEASDS